MGLMVKDGVRFASPEQAALIAVMVFEGCWRDLKLDIVNEHPHITGGVEDHEHPSKHVYGGAFDFRTRMLDEAQKEQLRALMKIRLGDGFDVVLEETHLHVEYDPKS